jgi:hypothetical protein
VRDPSSQLTDGFELLRLLHPLFSFEAMRDLILELGLGCAQLRRRRQRQHLRQQRPQHDGGDDRRGGGDRLRPKYPAKLHVRTLGDKDCERDEKYERAMIASELTLSQISSGRHSRQMP